MVIEAPHPPVANRAMIVPLEEFAEAQAARLLLGQVDNFITPDYIGALVYAKGLSFPEFEVGVRDGGDGMLKGARPGTVMRFQASGELSVTRLRTQSAYDYAGRYPFTIVVPHSSRVDPSGADMLYAIQKARNQTHLLQWSVHDHTPEAEDILKNARYAIFHNVNLQGCLPLAAIATDLQVLYMGDAVRMQPGHYKAIDTVLVKP